MAIYPVCKMIVGESIPIKADFSGKTYYFCSTSCLEKFKSNPNKYIK